jgi:nucleoside-diphosphate-sugar epimerase
MKITITGASGFVGQNLINYLEKDYDLIPLRTRYNQNENFNFNSSVVIHLSGKAHDLKKTTENKEYFEANTELTKKVFDQFLESSSKVFIFMSSVKAAKDVVHGFLSEDVFPDPKTLYGKSKLAAEEYILSKEIPENKRFYILRPCMIHGPNNKGNLNLLYNFISKGIPYPFGRFVNKRSFVSVDNLCFVIKELIANSKIESGIYNIADDISLSTIDLVEIISELLNKPTRVFKLPKLFVRFIAKIGDFIPILLNSERLQKLTENYEVSNLKIKKAIQKNLPLSSKEGIIKTVNSFLIINKYDLKK